MKRSLGARPLKEYQAYMVGEDGRISQRIDLSCENDEAASLQPLVPVNGDYFAAAGKAGSLPMSRRSCWMITVALRFAAIFFIRSIDATVCARS